MLEGDVLAQKWSGVESNVSKRQIWAPDPASLEAVRDYPSVRGTPAAPPDDKYAGGTLRGIRVLGAFLGDDEWRKTELVARVERALKPLEGILKLRDTKEIHTAQQVMQVLLRFCSNTTLTFFLRAMPPSVTLPAAERHDELIDAALYKLVGGARVGAAGTCWERARKQARLPVKMGGMGLTSAVDIREPAWIGTWALVAGPMRHLHAPFRDLDVSKAPGADFDELRAAHDRLKKEHGEITATWKEWDDKTRAEYFDLVGGTSRPPDVEVEPWDEPGEGEKLRASARPPEPATRVARSRASGRILSSRPRSCCPSPSSRPSTSSYTRRSGASRRWSTTGTGAPSPSS